MEHIRNAMQNIEESQRGFDRAQTVNFEQYLIVLRTRPETLIRNVHQVFHDMVQASVGTGQDEYPEDPESINFVAYDTKELFETGTDNPFFADRIFANRLMNMIDGFRGGTQQNKIYIFDGPPGCGKSIFLNNLLRKFQEYANSEDGCRYETVWHLDRSVLGEFADIDGQPVMDKLVQLLDGSGRAMSDNGADIRPRVRTGFVEVPCPSHDNPLLMIPKDQRSEFLDHLFANDEFKWNLSYGKEYDWVFKDNPCTICTTLYQALLHKLGDPAEVFKMINARPYLINRRLGRIRAPGDAAGSCG